MKWDCANAGFVTPAGESVGTVLLVATQDWCHSDECARQSLVFLLSLSSHLGGPFMSLYYPVGEHRHGSHYLHLSQHLLRHVRGAGTSWNV